jgi:hypothetical protein
VIPHTVTTIVRRWAKILMSSKVRNITRTRNKRPTIDGAKAQRLRAARAALVRNHNGQLTEGWLDGFRPSHYLEMNLEAEYSTSMPQRDQEGRRHQGVDVSNVAADDD